MYAKIILNLTIFKTKLSASYLITSISKAYLKLSITLPNNKLNK